MPRLPHSPFYRSGAPVALACVLLVSLAPGPATGGSGEEYQVKAALIHKLARFVRWPAEAFADNQAPFGVCVIGDDPFGPALDTLAGRTLGGRTIAVFRPAAIPDLGGRCQVLFIPESQRVGLAGLLKAIAPQPILSVSDIAGFARRGGILQMYSAASRIRFVINRAGARRAGLRIAAPLLDLAEVVGDGEGDSP